MKLLKNTIFSFQILFVHKLRTLLSLIGIIVGVGAVIVMTSVGRGAEKRIIDTIHNMGTNLIIVNAGQSRIIAGRQRQIKSVTTLIPKDVETILNNCPSVTLAAPATSKKIVARWETETSNSNVFGMTSNGFNIRNITVDSGRLFEEMENRAKRRVAIVGPTVVKNLFNNMNPVGLQFRLGSIPFEVIGVSSPKGTDINGIDQDDIIFVPLGTAMRRLFNVSYVQMIYIRAESTELLNSAECEARNVLRKTHRLQNKPDDFTIQNQALLLETEREAVKSMTLLISSVATLSLLVGGFGSYVDFCQRTYPGNRITKGTWSFAARYYDPIFGRSRFSYCNWWFGGSLYRYRNIINCAPFRKLGNRNIVAHGLYCLRFLIDCWGNFRFISSY